MDGPKWRPSHQRGGNDRDETDGQRHAAVLHRMLEPANGRSLGPHQRPVEIDPVDEEQSDDERGEGSPGDG